MHEALSAILTVTLIIALAGIAKGVAGMGLPTVAIGLLGLVMARAEAAALVVIPSLVTNVWQFLSGQHRLVLVRRTWSMQITMCLVTWAGAGLIAGTDAGRAIIGLGAALILYAVIGLAKVHLSVPRRYEGWLSPAVGATTGIVTGATGVFVIPAAPYLQALGLEKEQLMQALGLSFTTSTVALGVGLASHGAFQITDAWISSFVRVPRLLAWRSGG
jgi:uncharacterized protein